MRRILLIELRRSDAPWVAVALLAAGTWMLYAAPWRWTSGYMMLAMDQRWYLPFFLGLAMAAGAAQGRREHRSRVTELFAGVARPRLLQVAPILLAYGGAVVVAYAGATVLAALRIVGVAEYRPVGPVAAVVAAGALAMVAATWFGLVAGRLVPSIATAPALAILSLASPLIARGVTGNREWLSTLLFPAYGLGGTTDFATVDVRLSVAQLLYLTGLAAGAAMLYASVRRHALLPVLLGFAAAVLVLQGGSAFVKDPVDPVARELVCTEDAPQVCVARVHSGVLDEVTPPARAALARLARLPDAPDRAVELLDRESRVVDQPADALLIQLGIGDDGHALDVDRLERIMLDNVGVVPFVCPDDLPGTDRAVAEAATSWVTGAEPAAADARKLWNGLREIDQREAAARVSAVRRALLTCQSGAELLNTPRR